MNTGKLNPLGKINFPGFQEILDFTATGSESSVSVSVDGDTDKEYVILVANKTPDKYVYVRLNNNSTAGAYGYQYVYNSSGSISAQRTTADFMANVNTLEQSHMRLLTPAGFVKTLCRDLSRYTSGTTIGAFGLWAQVFNSTANIISLNFDSSGAGNWTSGTRITVYARRSNV